jgi:3-hydroxybutyryl-CoA dehydrogenase
MNAGAAAPARERVGVVGAGTIGAGVALALAQTGHAVVLVDRARDILDAAVRRMREGMRAHSLFRRGGDAPDGDAAISRIALATDLGALAEATFAIENVTEDWRAKAAVYPALDRICPPRCVFAANTSAILITRLAGLTARPDRVLGMHFMNPVPLKKTVEVIRGHHTSEPTLERAAALLGAMGKELILVGDSPGFVSNRVLMLTINEAIFLLHEHVASARDVDRVFKSCFGHPMGPLETADLIGLDTILFSIQVLHESFGDDKFRPCPLLTRMVAAGLLGRKSGQGFYSYGE